MNKILKELIEKETKIYGRRAGQRNARNIFESIQNSIEDKKVKTQKFTTRKNFYLNYLITNFYKNVEKRQNEQMDNLIRSKLDPSFAFLGSSFLTQYATSQAKKLNMEDLSDIDFLKEKSLESADKLKNVLMFNKMNIQDIDVEELRQDRNKYMEKMLEYFEYYNKSLENLVEGQREVVNDEEFEFEDGETVKERMDRMRKILQKVKGN